LAFYAHSGQGRGKDVMHLDLEVGDAIFSLLKNEESGFSCLNKANPQPQPRSGVSGEVDKALAVNTNHGH